jgi:hypothetical protein
MFARKATFSRLLGLDTLDWLLLLLGVALTGALVVLVWDRQHAICPFDLRFAQHRALGRKVSDDSTSVTT